MRTKIAKAQIEALYEQAASRCEICGADERPGRKLAIDHNHQTGNIRGLLCRSCNLGLGSFRDDSLLLLSAVEYLARNGHTPVPKPIPNPIAIRRAERKAWWEKKQ